jgi:hypothetical protein
MCLTGLLHQPGQGNPCISVSGRDPGSDTPPAHSRSPKISRHSTETLTVASTVLASVKALYFLHSVRLPTRELLEDGLITYLVDNDDTDSSDRESPQSHRNSRKRVNDLGQEPGLPARLFQIPKNRQKKKIRISNPLISSSGPSPQIPGPQLTSSASISETAPSLSSPTSLISRKGTRGTNLAHIGTSQSRKCDQAPSVNGKQSFQKRPSDPQWWVDSEADASCKPTRLRCNAVIEYLSSAFDSNDTLLDHIPIHPSLTNGQSDALWRRWRQLNGKRRRRT